MSPRLRHLSLGALPYDDALVLQRSLHAERLRGEGEDTVLTLEHLPGVLTAGRRARPENLVATAEVLAARGIQLRDVDRGGDWTWHGPGQLVAYPIVALAGWGLDVPAFVAGLETAMVEVARRALLRIELDPGRLGRRPGYPGCWLWGPAGLVKLGAVGVHVRRFVSLHGLALNLDPDPWGFAHIVPCGLAEPTSSLGRLARAAGRDPSLLPTVAEAGAWIAELLPRCWGGEVGAAEALD